MNRADGIDCYQKALRQGQRDYREKMNAGQSPFLPVLDDILQNVPVENQIPLGQVEIPLELLVGTKTSGRTAAFASNFMPLLGLKTEFATKWINLCVSHVDEGIRDPITCYEYMGRFYVQEGNKRVSVLKYFDASSITGNVTRVVPQYSDDPAVQMYYEFMHFYPVMQNYLLTFTKPGSYARLQKILGKAPDEKWTGEDRTEVVSLYNWVKKAFLALHQGGAGQFKPQRAERKARRPVGRCAGPAEIGPRAGQRQARRPETDRPAGFYPARQAHRAQPFEGCLCA